MSGGIPDKKDRDGVEHQGRTVIFILEDDDENAWDVTLETISEEIANHNYDLLVLTEGSLFDMEAVKKNLLDTNVPTGVCVLDDNNNCQRVYDAIMRLD